MTRRNARLAAAFSFAAFALLTLALGVATLAQEDAVAPENPGEKIDSSLAEAMQLYRDGDYAYALELLERATERLRSSHTARDGDLIARTVDAYFLHVMKDEYEEAFSFLHAPAYMRRRSESLAPIYATAKERGLAIHGFSVLRVRFDEPEKAWADVLVTGPGNDFVEASVRVEKLYVDGWIIMGHPARRAGHLSCLLPLESHPASCAEKTPSR